MLMILIVHRPRPRPTLHLSLKHASTPSPSRRPLVTGIGWLTGEPGLNQRDPDRRTPQQPRRNGLCPAARGNGMDAPTRYGIDVPKWKYQLTTTSREASS